MKHKDARVSIPTNKDIKKYKAAVSSRHLLLKDVWMTMDGLKLYLEQSPNCPIQDYFYNGWMYNHFVLNVQEVV